LRAMRWTQPGLDHKKDGKRQKRTWEGFVWFGKSQN